VAILGILASLVTVNFNQLRGPRNVRIAEHELVTNIRKVQSYALSSRSTETGIPVKYYVVAFDLADPHQYQVAAIDKDFNFLAALETIYLPPGVAIAAMNLESPQGTPLADPGCMQVIFGLPFARVYLDGNSDSDGSCDFISLVQSPLELENHSNGLLKIILMDEDGTATKTVRVIGISGKIDTE
jgi:hypothetical protein